jgi:predicted RNA-binding protein YlxR (DUF448 family)
MASTATPDAAPPAEPGGRGAKDKGRRRAPSAGGAAERAAPKPTADDPEAERGPMRRCIVTRESGPKEAMLRFVLSPGREVVADLAGKLPGRGMWLSAKADVIERAVKRGAFAKVARGTVSLPPDLRMVVEDGLRRRLRDLVGFARRGGQAICGREAVRDWLQTGKAGLLVEASDGSPNERARLVGGRGLPVVSPLTADELGIVFGRDHAVHVAIAPGRMAEAIATDSARLAGVAVSGGAMTNGTGGASR